MLQDAELLRCVNADTPLIENFDPNQLTNIGYDLRAEYFAVSKENSRMDSYLLKPQDSVFVGTVENIHMPNNLIGHVVLKNSRIRQGLALDAPVYQPGHETKVFFRVTNLSANSIELQSNESLATIIFEELKGNAEHPYEGTFSQEMNFSGMGAYDSVYRSHIRQIEEKIDSVKEIERGIYSNVLVILTVFVALFSFLTANISFATSGSELKQFLVYNTSLLGCVSFLTGVLSRFVFEKKGSALLFVLSLAFLVGSILLYILL